MGFLLLVIVRLMLHEPIGDHWLKNILIFHIVSGPCVIRIHFLTRIKYDISDANKVVRLSEIINIYLKFKSNET